MSRLQGVNTPTMSNARLLGFAGALVVAALVGGTVISAVAASPGAGRAATSGPANTAGQAAPSAGAVTAAAPTAAPTGGYCETYRAAFAKALGTTEADVTAAARSAADSTIDAAVADGKLTAAAGDRLKAKVAAAGPDICQRIAKRLGGAKPALGVVRDAIAAAADALGTSPADVRTQLRDGGSLKTIASTNGVDYATVTAAVLGAVKTDLDAAVKAGTIPQAREDRILQRLTTRLANGTVRGS
jgi:ribosomal protein S20